MNRKMATYLRFGPVVALLAILAAAFALLPVGKAGAVLTAIAVTINPDTAGTVAEYNITFTTDRALTANTGEIQLTFDKDIGFPASISRSSVFLTASAVGPIGALGIPGQSVNPPTDPTISNDTVDSRRKRVTMKVPDMDPGTTGNSAAVNSILANAVVTVTFGQSAGLVNVKEAEITAAGAGATQLFVLTREGGVADPVGGDPGTARGTITAIPRSITLNRVDGSRGQAVTVSGRGYKAGLTATVYRDVAPTVPPSAFLVGTDETLAEVTVGADSTFTTTITMGGGFAIGANTINATDGTVEVGDGVIPQATIGRGLRLRGKASVAPKEGRRGDTITVTLEDFAVGAVLNELTLGGADILPQVPVASRTFPGTPGPTTVLAGRLTATVTVPLTTPVGVQEVRGGAAALAAVVAAAGPPAVAAVAANGADNGRSTLFTVKPAALTVAPGTAVPNQSITISGTGFTQGGAVPATCAAGAGVVTILANSITIGGAMTTHGIICVDNGGNWVVSPPLIVPINTTTLTAGSYQVRVVDSGGVTGEGTLTIPARSISVSPVSSRQRSSITVSGIGFPANNSQAAADNRTATINYAAGGLAAAATATPTPDASGRFSVTMTVPTTAGIPSDNTITATVPAGATTSTATSTAIHAVPSATITVNPAKGVPGTSITVSGSNFPTFSNLTGATLGARNVIPSPAPSTDREGNFTATLLAPDLDVGVQSVVVTVGGTTATAAFEIATAPAAPAAPAVVASVAPAAALAPLGANLVRVWGFNAATQRFQLYDPAAALLSDLTALNRGAGYWINVKAAQSAALGTGSYSLSAGWNLVGWLG